MELIHRQIANAKRQLKNRNMLASVQHYPVVGRDEAGPKWSDDPTDLDVLVEDSGEPVQMGDGTVTVSKAKLTIFEPLTINERDKFIVDEADGEQFVMRKKALLDSEKVPYLTEVWLGARQQ